MTARLDTNPLFARAQRASFMFERMNLFQQTKRTTTRMADTTAAAAAVTTLAFYVASDKHAVLIPKRIHSERQIHTDDMASSS